MLLLHLPILLAGNLYNCLLQHFVILTNILNDRLYNVITVKLYPTENSKKDSSIVSATLGLFPFINMCFWAYKWMRVWPEIVSDHLAIFIIFFGLLFGHQVGLMITAHVSKLRFPYFNIPVTAMLFSGYIIAYCQEYIEEYVYYYSQKTSCTNPFNLELFLLTNVLYSRSI